MIEAQVGPSNLDLEEIKSNTGFVAFERQMQGGALIVVGAELDNLRVPCHNPEVSTRLLGAA